MYRKFILAFCNFHTFIIIYKCYLCKYWFIIYDITVQHSSLCHVHIMCKYFSIVSCIETTYAKARLLESALIYSACVTGSGGSLALALERDDAILLLLHIRAVSSLGISAE